MYLLYIQFSSFPVLILHLFCGCNYSPGLQQHALHTQLRFCPLGPGCRTGEAGV